jgi:hypothetical protein
MPVQFGAVHLQPVFGPRVGAPVDVTNAGTGVQARRLTGSAASDAKATQVRAPAPSNARNNTDGAALPGIGGTAASLLPEAPGEQLCWPSELSIFMGPMRLGPGQTLWQHSVLA